MELRDLGQLFIIGFNGTNFSDELREIIEDFNPAGVILFSRNIENEIQIAVLNHDLQTYAQKVLGSGIFIGIDQEGGRVSRLKSPFSVFPSAMELACSSDPERSVADFAERTASELNLIGFNLNFVPVLDVLSSVGDPRKTVIGDRSFGREPQAVCRFGRIVIEHMRRNGIIPCCKHFPGHGGTSVDSHADLPVDNRGLTLLEQRDLIPFKEAVAMHIEMMMTAHVLYTELDDTAPATLSEIIIQKLLRKKMSYQGVIATDDLEMGAVSKYNSPDECAVKALKAGADILLFCSDPQKSFSARSAIHDALKQKKLSQDRIRESIHRILNLKSRYAESLKPCDEMMVRQYFKIKG